MQDKINHSINEEKLKVLSPTLRDKKRFIRFQIISNKKFTFKELSYECTNHILYYIGAIDFAKSGIWFLAEKSDEKKQELILRVGTKFKDKTIGSLVLMNKIKDLDCKIDIKRVSGTLKGVMKE